MNLTQATTLTNSILIELGIEGNDVLSLIQDMIIDHGSIESDEILITLEAELGIAYSILEDTQAYDDYILAD